MKKSISALGETEMEILHHVWRLGEASVSQVHKEILKDRKVAYTTVMTVMKNLADKGYLKFRKEGVSYIYTSQEQPEKVKHKLLTNIVSKVFKGSPAALVQNLVENEKLSKEEREQIEKLIQKMGE